MSRIFIFIFIICFSIASISIAQTTLHITGEYLDKKNNPLENASVEYLLWGTNNIGTTTSGNDGSFDLLISLTEINEAKRIFTQVAYPNPFSDYTSF